MIGRTTPTERSWISVSVTNKRCRLRSHSVGVVRVGFVHQTWPPQRETAVRLHVDMTVFSPAVTSLAEKNEASFVVSGFECDSLHLPEQSDWNDVVNIERSLRTVVAIVLAHAVALPHLFARLRPFRYRTVCCIHRSSSDSVRRRSNDLSSDVSPSIGRVPVTNARFFVGRRSVVRCPAALRRSVRVFRPKTIAPPLSEKSSPSLPRCAPGRTTDWSSPAMSRVGIPNRFICLRIVLAETSHSLPISRCVSSSFQYLTSSHQPFRYRRAIGYRPFGSFCYLKSRIEPPRTRPTAIVEKRSSSLLTSLRTRARRHS